MSPRPPVALILAAGVGSRLGRPEALPKVLLRFAGRSLLERHLAALAGCGVEELVLGLGYRADAIAGELGSLTAPLAVRTVLNERYTEGSVVTLAGLLDAPGVAGRDVLVMDADVLYHRGILERLVGAPHPGCCLLDRDLEPGEEPVKLRVREGRPVELRKRPDPGIAYDVQGESVGFFRFDAAMAASLRAACAPYLASVPQTPHEEAIRDLILADRDRRIGYEDVTGLAWIEIDFEDDLARAERDVLPHLGG